MNNIFSVGQSVTRTNSNDYGMRGTVVEINAASRVRVLWPTMWTQGGNGRRTWVSQSTITDSKNVTDKMIEAYKNRSSTTRPAAVVKAAPKPVAEPEYKRSRFVVETVEGQNVPFCFDITDRQTGRKDLLGEAVSMFYALDQAIRLERSKRPEKMLERIRREMKAE